MSYKVQKLPLKVELETKRVLKSLPKAHAALAELKGIADTIPNQSILINTLTIQEAKDSSEVENIFTTHDEMYKSQLFFEQIKSLGTKEVQNYLEALKLGYDLVLDNNLLSIKIINDVQEKIEKNNAGFRKVPGTTIKNHQTGEVIYTPPQDHKVIISLMNNLENFINDDSFSDLDDLVKMALIHFQFESIHPYYDGNGRTGRIINILYLLKQGLLKLPILYLSRYIIKNKKEYYDLLQGVRDHNNWEQWILFMIDGVKITSLETIELIKDIKMMMQDYKVILRDNFKFYSQDLLNNLFKHPYTKIDFLMDDLHISRQTSSSYLKKLCDYGLLEEKSIGVSKYFINKKLFDLLIK